MRLPGERTRVRWAGSGDARGTPQTARPCRVVLRGESRIGTTRADAAKIGVDAAQVGPTRSVSAVSADIGRYRPNLPVSAETARFGPKFKKKKKKKVQNAPFDLT